MTISNDDEVFPAVRNSVVVGLVISVTLAVVAVIVRTHDEPAQLNPIVVNNVVHPDMPENGGHFVFNG
ncbi:MAG TPA: hypothetical protein VFX16_27205 [Pseudonocardiaceae bacterium]|nr:hypothetical protein [Pseudonocardiaceae bacterium]